MSLQRRPEKTVLNYVPRILLVLVVHQLSIHEPRHIWLRPSCKKLSNLVSSWFCCILTRIWQDEALGINGNCPWLVKKENWRKFIRLPRRKTSEVYLERVAMAKCYIDNSSCSWPLKCLESLLILHGQTTGTRCEIHSNEILIRIFPHASTMIVKRGRFH